MQPDVTVMRLLRVTRDGVWSRPRDEATFHVVLMMAHFVSVWIHAGAAVHHGILATRAIWRRG